MFNILLPQIGNQKAPENKKEKTIKRINDLTQKPSIDKKEDQKDEVVFDAQMSWSNKSTIKSKDFEMMSLDEINVAKQEIKKLLINFKKDKTRRWNKLDNSMKILPKETIKKAIRGGITICPIAVPILAIEVISPLLDSNHFAIVDRVDMSCVLSPAPIKKMKIKNKCQTSLDLEKRMKPIPKIKPFTPSTILGPSRSFKNPPGIASTPHANQPAAPIDDRSVLDQPNSFSSSVISTP